MKNKKYDSFIQYFNKLHKKRWRKKGKKKKQKLIFEWAKWVDTYDSSINHFLNLSTTRYSN